VIVESPAKAKTIQKYLGSDYDVQASVGHIRDLPRRAAEIPAELKKLKWAKLGVDVENGFAPLYVVDSQKRERVSELKKKLKDATELLLATDEDREGEAIAWHLLEVLKPKVPVRRMVFHEITEHAIREAAETTREIDQRLVDAQEARRILDRLYGYEVSPVLWKKVQQGLSAGRVQSVTLRLVVDRERERMAFRAADYWDISATFDPGKFDAALTQINGQKIAGSDDFDSRGVQTREAAVRLDEDLATKLVDELAGKPFKVADVVDKPYRRSPQPPFMTSTLQREAGNRLGWSAQRAMRVAQSLYERGYITYMRTDSTSLSESAVKTARAQAAEIFGADAVQPEPRRYDRKVKNAQEAHEAIRPAGDIFRTPDKLGTELNVDELALYDMVWRRTLASQMADARGTTSTVKIQATAGSGELVEFSASGTVITSPGFRAALDDLVAADEANDEDRKLPKLNIGDELQAKRLEPVGHSTQPPARFTEASLVKELEARGIGRPSTYASTIATILDRGYVWRKGRALVPSWLGMVVIRLLEEHFASLVDYDFTAQLEEILDLIANGDEQRLSVLTAFYFGDDARGYPGLTALANQLGEIDARELSSFPVEGGDMTLRVGRYGPYIEQGEIRVSVPDDMAPDELNEVSAKELIARPSNDRELGVHPDTGRVIALRVGRFGPYVSELLPEGTEGKPATASLFKTMDPATIDLETALKLMALPRLVGADPADGVEIMARNGPYGPYIFKDKETRSLASEDEIFTVTVEQALELLSQPKKRRGPQQLPPLREIGIDPATSKPIILKKGRYGPYVTDGETNASLRTGDEPESIDLLRAAELLADRRARGPVQKSGKRAKKSAAPKSSAGKASKGGARTKKAPTLTRRTKKATHAKLAG